MTSNQDGVPSRNLIDMVMPGYDGVSDYRTVGVQGNVTVDLSREILNLKADPAKHVGLVMGMCKLLSKGDACTCLKCVIDKAAERDILRKAINDYLDTSSTGYARVGALSSAPVSKLAAVVGR